MVETCLSMGLVMTLYVESIVSFCFPHVIDVSAIVLMLYMCSASCVLYSAGSGVKGAHVVLSGLRMRLFVCVHVFVSCRYY